MDMPGMMTSTLEFLVLPPVECQAAADRMTAEDKRQIIEELAALVQKAAWKWAYLDDRYGGGCGDQGHADSVKNANKVLRAARKAMGFTYPERGAIRV